MGAWRGKPLRAIFIILMPDIPGAKTQRGGKGREPRRTPKTLPPTQIFPYYLGHRLSRLLLVLTTTTCEFSLVSFFLLPLLLPFVSRPRHLCVDRESRGDKYSIRNINLTHTLSPPLALPSGLPPESFHLAGLSRSQSTLAVSTSRVFPVSLHTLVELTDVSPSIHLSPTLSSTNACA